MKPNRHTFDVEIYHQGEESDKLESLGIETGNKEERTELTKIDIDLNMVYACWDLPDEESVRLYLKNSTEFYVVNTNREKIRELQDEHEEKYYKEAG